jgi:pimeloyl-ACP methyl ester carboxylesterase
MATGVIVQKGIGQRRINWVRLLARLAVAVGALALVVYLGVSAYAADKVTHASRLDPGTCAEFGLTCQDVEFTSTVDNIPLKGWFVDSSGSKTVLIVHGRDGVRSDKTIGIMDITKALQANGYDVLLYDARDHGLSGGERYTLGALEVRDIEGALEYLTSQGRTQVGVLGFSMGGATALRTAPTHPEMAAIVTDSAFADAKPMIDYSLSRYSGVPAIFNPGIRLVSRLLVGVDVWALRPEQEIAQLGDRPLLLIHSADDTYDDGVPVEHMYQLERAAEGNPNLRTWAAPGRGHVQSYNNNSGEYVSRVLAFFGDYLK